MIRPQPEHKALAAIRRQQQTQQWKKRYDKRAGIEGALISHRHPSPGVEMYTIDRFG